PDGSTEIVLVATSTPIMKVVAGSTADLTVGADIAAHGSGNGDGSFTASSVQIRPAGGAGFGARGGGG
ncbi:MAG: hypothetical protein KGI03_03840, partial [Patescibacteria group bacterium]|nr:hypothetical protein [Patescibacteria group bacterium]